MSELGRVLSEARAAKRATLAEVETGTRIRQKYLEALETGSFAELPRGPVARGFLRTYAEYLGLDPEEVLRQYSEESGDVEAEIPIAEPGKPRYVDYRPLEVELVDSRPAPSWFHWVVALLVVVALAIVAWWFFGRDWTAGWSSLAFWAAPTSTPTATNTPTPWIVTATPSPAPSAEPIMVTPTSDLLLLPTPTVAATITPTPLPTTTPEIVPQIAMTVTVNQRAWVRVVADGQVVQEGILEGGESRFWEAAESLVIRTGNAGGVNLILNDEDLGPMGDIGQVVERTWIVEQGQVAETTPEILAATATATATVESGVPAVESTVAAVESTAAAPETAAETPTPAEPTPTP
jgi:cytoskeleton protein RodZ